MCCIFLSLSFLWCVGNRVCEKKRKKGKTFSCRLFFFFLISKLPHTVDLCFGIMATYCNFTLMIILIQIENWRLVGKCSLTLIGGTAQLLISYNENVDSSSNNLILGLLKFRLLFFNSILVWRNLHHQILQVPFVQIIMRGKTKKK